MQRSPISWVGGKSRVRTRIIPLIPEHKVYIEVFCGAAWVLFGKPKDWSKGEVINDINDDLVNFYRVLKDDRAKFIREFKYRLVARTEFTRLLRLDPTRLTPPERAARFYYLIQCSFSAMGQNFHITKSRPTSLHFDGVTKLAGDAWERLQRVTVENLDFERCIRAYDAKENFFFLDPPYIDQNYYGFQFGDEEHERLAKVLKSVKGKFLLTINDCAMARRLYRKFRVKEISVSYRIGHANRAAGAFRNLLISNFKPKARKV